MPQPVDRVDALASAIIQEDLPDIVEQLSWFLTHHDLVDLAGKLEICPVHFCAEEICLDDGDTCQPRRS